MTQYMALQNALLSGFSQQIRSVQGVQYFEVYGEV